MKLHIIPPGSLTAAILCWYKRSNVAMSGLVKTDAQTDSKSSPHPCMSAGDRFPRNADYARVCEVQRPLCVKVFVLAQFWKWFTYPLPVECWRHMAAVLVKCVCV